MSSNREYPDFGAGVGRTLNITDEDGDHVKVHKALDASADGLLLTVINGEHIDKASQSVYLDRKDARALRLYLTHFLQSKPVEPEDDEDEDED